MSKTTSSRRVNLAKDPHTTATTSATIKDSSLPATTANINSSTQATQRAYITDRLRTEQQCRDYWRAVYGQDAERASRGGVTWLWGGCNG